MGHRLRSPQRYIQFRHARLVANAERLVLARCWMAGCVGGVRVNGNTETNSRIILVEMTRFPPPCYLLRRVISCGIAPGSRRVSVCPRREQRLQLYKQRTNTLRNFSKLCMHDDNDMLGSGGVGAQRGARESVRVRGAEHGI